MVWDSQSNRFPLFQINTPAFTPSPLFVSPLLQSTCSVSLSRVANTMGREFVVEDHFSDFEEEIKKHVNLPQEVCQEREEEVVTAMKTPSITNGTTPTSPSQIVQKEKRSEKNKKGKKSKKKGKLIAQRIIIRRSTKGFAQGSPKWTTMDAVNNNNSSSKMPSCSVNLNRFKNPSAKTVKVELPTVRITAQPPPPPPSAIPEFTLLQKLEEVPPYTVLDTHVKREATPGPILGTYYDERERILLVVTEKKVTFFQHHTTVAMFQKVVPSPRNSKNGLQHSVKPRCAWSQIDSVDRMTRDEQVTELLFEKRIMAGDGGKTSASFVYVELRGQPLKKDRDYRTGDMCATYVNLYYLSRGGEDQGDLAIEAKTVALDTIVA